MRTTTQIKLPVSGILADVIESWTFGEFEQIENATKTMARLHINADGSQDVSLADAGADDRLAMRLAVKKLTAADGSDIPVTDEAISTLHLNDGKALQQAVKNVGANEKKD